MMKAGSGEALTKDLELELTAGTLIYENPKECPIKKLYYF